MHYKRILVTGGGAVTGQAVKSLQSEYSEQTPDGAEFFYPTSRECDLTDSNATLKLFETLQPDAVIHLAAKSGGIGLTMKYPATLLRDNVAMNMNILEASRLCGVKKLIMTLSAGMYPEKAPLPLKEECLHDGRPPISVNTYAYAKRLIEPAIWAYRKEFGLNVIGLIPNGIFGPFDNFNEDSAPMLPSLIKRFHTHRNGSEPLVVWGDGSPLREYTYSVDVARAFLWALDNYNEEQILNSGTTEELSIKEIAYAVAAELGISPTRIQFDTNKPNGVLRKSVDNSRFVKLSGFKYTPFKVGLTQTISWFKEQMEKGGDSIRTYSKG